MHSRSCSFVILGLIFFFTVLSTIRLFSAKRSVATLLPEVPMLVPILAILLGLFIRPLASLLVASLVASLVPMLVAPLVASLSLQIVEINSSLKSISGARSSLTSCRSFENSDCTLLMNTLYLGMFILLFCRFETYIFGGNIRNNHETHFHKKQSPYCVTYFRPSPFLCSNSHAVRVTTCSSW